MGIENYTEGMDTMPFIKEGVTWVYCVVCDAEVSVASSVPVSANEMFRACKTHYPRFSGV
ncbi:MAG: hypothetical protein KGI73_01885 [Patescibacteria group bacterium]|nr:hypothetical protein [Patescibacteria group bacterium]